MPRKIKGYMFTINPKHALLFKADRIHMWFVFFKMKAIWLDKDKRVLRVDKCSPFSLKTWFHEDAKWILEIPDEWDFPAEKDDVLEF